MNIQNDEYRTKDLGEASGLLSKSVMLLRLQRENNFYWFVFQNKELCEKLSHDYWFGKLLINARDYYEQMRMLKDRLFSQK